MDELELHPLSAVFGAVNMQVMHGKGVRHGGAMTPFMEQPWRRHADAHGTGFLTGQAAKKLEEAQQWRDSDPERWEREMLGAIAYAGMAILHQKGKAPRHAD